MSSSTLSVAKSGDIRPEIEPAERLIAGQGPQAQTLCHLCSKIDTVLIDSLKPEDAAYVVAHHDFGALEQSAADGCSLCKLFHHEIEQYRGTKSKYFNRGQLNIFFQAVDVDGRTKVLVEYRDTAVDRHSYHLLSTDDKLNRLLTPFPDLRLCSRWLNTCCGPSQTAHGNCPALLDVKLPSRVLAVGTLPDDPVKLVETGNTKGTYACLSHCWGSAPVSTRTLHSNLEQHLQGFPLVYLPQTFRDAVIVCRSLGLPYLWIDSLCIIQDSSKDWESECVQMCSIYQNAALTIAASSSESADGGFLHPRKRQTCTSCLIPPKNPDGPAYIISAWPRSVAGSWLSSLELPPAALLERAWVVQECLLSPRMIFFYEDELYFDCFAGRFREAYPDIAHRHHPQNSFQIAQYNKIALSPSNIAPFEENLLDIWFSIVHEYSLTHLSYQSDVLPALSGLAESVALRSNQVKAHLGDYVAGLWSHKDQFYKCLLWHATEKRKQYRIPAEENLPSWSWASCHRTVDHFIHGNDKHPLFDIDIEVDHFDVHLTGLNPYGSVQLGASIHMSGYLKAYIIKTSSHWRTSRNGRSKRRLSVWTTETGDASSVELVGFDPDSPDFANEGRDEEVVGLSVCVNVHLHWYGLVLQEVGPKTYRRVGICEVNRAEHLSASPEQVHGRMTMRRAGIWQDFILV